MNQTLLLCSGTIEKEEFFSRKFGRGQSKLDNSQSQAKNLAASFTDLMAAFTGRAQEPSTYATRNPSHYLHADSCHVRGLAFSLS
jgi:hypothetical protein